MKAKEDDRKKKKKLRNKPRRANRCYRIEFVYHHNVFHLFSAISVGFAEMLTDGWTDEGADKESTHQNKGLFIKSVF